MTQGGIEYDLAKETHARFYQWSLNLNNHSVEIGVHALKTAGIINGSASVALLALIGSFSESDLIQKLDASHLATAFGCFGAGTALSACAAFCAYFLTLALLDHSQSYEYIYQPPFIKETAATPKKESITFYIRVSTIGFVLCSYIAFVWGIYEIKCLIENTRIWA